MAASIAQMYRLAQTASPRKADIIRNRSRARRKSLPYGSLGFTTINPLKAFREGVLNFRGEIHPSDPCDLADVV